MSALLLLVGLALAGDLPDLNQGSAASLDELPGVGPARAAAILAHRQAHGPFLKLSDLLEVTGFGPGTVAAIQGRATLAERIISANPAALSDRSAPRLTVPSSVSRLSLNTATEVQLVNLPGISPVLATAIIDERRRALFANCSDLSRVVGIGPATIHIVSPLLECPKEP